MMIISKTAHKHAVVTYIIRRLRDNLIKASNDIRPGIKKATMEERFHSERHRKHKRE